MHALAAFGAPLEDISEADLTHPGVVYQIGVAPGRIDILTELTGLAFEDAWPGRIRHARHQRPVHDVERVGVPRIGQREVEVSYNFV